MKRILLSIMALSTLFLSQLILISPPLLAEKVDLDTAKQSSCSAAKGTIDADSKDCVGGNTMTGVFQTIANVILFLVGAIAVIMIIVGGFKFVTANGDTNAVTGAKNTIMYAIIGIVVAFLAYAAVNFVVTQLAAGAK